MPSRLPKLSDFSSHHTVTVTHPSSKQEKNQSQALSSNIVLLLHGIGDSAASFTKFAQALNLPETTIITLQAPSKLPFDLPGFHWGDDISFNSTTGELETDAGFERALQVIVDQVILEILVGKCGWLLGEIMVFGFGQGGMVGLCAARELGKKTRATTEGGELRGVISIGAPFPLSSSVTGPKCRSPVLVVAGSNSMAVTDGAVKRTENAFEFVEVARYKRKGDGMPRSHDEMVPIMRFFARRLLSRKGVPEGSVEVTGLHMDII